MELSLIISFLGASILLTFMPGPDILLVLTESLSRGKKYGMYLAIGLISGVLVHTAAAATGLSLFIKNSETAYTTIKYFGAAYLCYLAYQAIIEKNSIPEFNTQSKSDESAIGMIPKGFLMNVLNPKVTLFFIAFLPQFVSPTGWNITVQMLVLGMIFMLQGLLIFGLIAVLSGSLYEYFKSPSFWKYTRWFKLIVLLGLAFYLLL